ncbi:MAG: DUF3098 domain-containing protein [Bacteroidaceae bacterium]|nr:DUF3098 domain-containing protein [Bacteroidaceae bacterium]
MKKKFAFDKINYILIAIGVAIILIGFALMAGPSSTETAFEPSIFSVRRIKVAPIVCLIGFIFMIPAIMYRPKKKTPRDEENPTEK